VAVADPQGSTVEVEAGRATSLEDGVHEVDGVGVGPAALDDRVDDLAERAADAPDASELGVTDGHAGIRVDQLVLQEPHCGVGRTLEMFVACVLLIGSAVTGVERVEEVESGLEIDAVRVLGGVQIWHLVTVRFPCR
jgi:hypothetical protein